MKCAGLMLGRLLLPLLTLPWVAGAQKFYTYVGQIGVNSVVLAWGRAELPGNTIGLNSESHGKAVVKIGSQSVETERNWITIEHLRPDTEYSYEVRLGERVIGEGGVRTYPEHSDALAFFVIGDYGNGGSRQYKVADAMVRAFEQHRSSPNPVRFVLTVGDNIYSDATFGNLALRSGNEDRHWDQKYFRPYERVIRHIPFHPTLGNHDGNVSESRGDLAVYLDNFFFPGLRPARWYTFSYGGLADFFALDSTDITEQGPPRPAYALGGEQFRWLREVLSGSHAAWKIPYLHHPPFNAGPRHGTSFDALLPFIDLFEKSGVKVVFTGHEHNFQFSTQDQATGGMCFVISGAGGELRKGNVTHKMERAHIAGWAGQNHFLLVEILGRSMRITPISYEPIKVVDKNGDAIQIPVVVNLQSLEKP